MKELAAFLLAQRAGNAGSAADIKKILSSVGAEADSEAVSAITAAVDGKVSRLLGPTLFSCCEESTAIPSPAREAPPPALPHRRTEPAGMC
jgi:ribosomal protein L12E/L44/L45/RPP1/RPP2